MELPAPGPRERARALYSKGLDHYARGDGEAMFRAMRAALEADPTYLPPVVETLAYFHVSLTLGFAPTIRSILDSLATQSDHPMSGCFRGRLAQVDARYDDAMRGPMSEECTAYLRPGSNYRVADQAAVATATRFLGARYPESPSLVGNMLDVLGVDGRWDSVLTLAGGLLGRANPELLRAVGFGYLVRGLHAAGRHAEAVESEAAAEDFLRESPPRVRSLAVGALHWQWHRGGSATATRWLEAHAESVRTREGDWWSRIIEEADEPLATHYRITRAEGLLDSGDLARSLALWDSIVSEADGLALPRLQAHVYLRRGRTRVKLGDWDAGGRDLLTAAALAARQTSLAPAYETQHNLLHLYEAMGSTALARKAGERFVTLTGEGGLHPVRMMSYHDFGWFLRRQGEHEQARRMFEAMVADIDSMIDQWENAFFAGEYFESIGDLDRAAEYYQRTASGSQPVRALEALARVAEATGDIASALRYARSAEALLERTYPEYRPLLPGVLARTGRVDEAVRELQRVRTHAAQVGRIAGWARLSHELAELEYRRGSTRRAAFIADSAAAAAARVGDAELATRARALGGLARVQLGHHATGMAALAAARRQAHTSRLPQLEADVAVVQGEALATRGRVEEAFAALRRAADLTDSIAVSLAHDPTRAGFRAATQRRVSNRALTAVLARARDSLAPAWFVGWSAWRKSRELPPADGSARSHREWGSDLLARIQSRLGSDDVVIDYAVLDSVVAAFVATDVAVRVVRLPVEADTVRARARALSRAIAPRLGSSVDAGRSRFLTSVAHQLYHDLLQPLELVIGDRSRLTIIADAPLHLVPFDALVISDTGVTPTFVVDRATVTFAPSLASARPLPGRLPAGPALVMAGPAKNGLSAGADREVDVIARALHGREVTRFEGSTASEGAVRRHAGRTTLLHFAAHAQPNAYQPDYGAITLAPDEQDDGLLHVHEIRALDLRGSVVVLSACESAGGRLAGGEGPLSLSRAFLQAGASSVVGTLWPVGEATVALMERFYELLAIGWPLADALREAKLFLRTGDYPDPFYWAAFGLVSTER